MAESHRISEDGALDGGFFDRSGGWGAFRAKSFWLVGVGLVAL